MTDVVTHAFALVQQWVFEAWVQPAIFAAGLMTWDEQAFDATEWLLLGAIEVLALWAILAPLERRYAIEPLVDRRARRVDMLYTMLHRLGAFPLLAFALLVPVFDTLEAHARLVGVSRLELDRWLPPALDHPLVSFLVYLVVLDFVDYGLHRAQHRYRWWWALHAVHHSQRQMTFWTDPRNHLLDDLVRDAAMAGLAIFIGVAPAQFALLVVASRVAQSVQHANVRLRLPWLLERIVVSPAFHRRHHAIGAGHEGHAGGCNFGVLLPWWDALFGTADFRPGFLPTGIRDQLEGRDYGRGFWAQQWLGLRRLARGDR